MVDWTDEQLDILGWDPREPARILAGPGTGKSTTVLELARRLLAANANLRIRVATFSRAATADLVERAVEHDVPLNVTTVHAFALSLLQRNPDRVPRLLNPLRIPDEWEFKNLLHADLRDRLSDEYDGNLRRSHIERLEREMAARWEALDPEQVLHAEVDPGFRNAYIREWNRQREVFRYTLFAELPWYAHEMLQDHPNVDGARLDVFIVDEFQDLNACEISLIQELAQRGAYILAVGDDDQSIYSWRMAAPEGIRNFLDEFRADRDMPLSVSQRCSRRILEVSQDLIETSPDHMGGRPRVRPGDDAPEGTFAYLRFESAALEREAVQVMISRLLAQGYEARKIAVLLRGDYHGTWSRPLRARLDAVGIPYIDVETAILPLHEPPSRQLLALARLFQNEYDSLAWWTLLHLTPRVSFEFTQQVADAARADGVTFAERLRRIEAERVPETTDISHNRAVERVKEVVAFLHDSGVAEVLNAAGGFPDSLLELADQAEIELSDEMKNLLRRVADNAEEDQGLGVVLSQLEPIVRDDALKEDGVAIMKIMRSKGLTFDAVITMGVEHELFPSPMSERPEEDRRLLYVAITRARLTSILTMSRDRNDATAFAGGGDAENSRSRVQYLSEIGVKPEGGQGFLDAWPVPDHPAPQ